MHEERNFLMSRFRCLSRHTPNLKNAIFWKALGATSSNFQFCLVFIIPTTGKSLKKTERYGWLLLNDLTWLLPYFYNWNITLSYYLSAKSISGVTLCGIKYPYFNTIILPTSRNCKWLKKLWAGRPKDHVVQSFVVFP